VLYLVSGNDEFRREEFVGQLKELMRRLPMGEHNLLELESDATVRDLVSACDTVPFLSDKRMVIARGLLSQPRSGGDSSPGRRPRGGGEPRSRQDELLAYLPMLPETTHLVLVEQEEARVVPLAAARSDVVRRHFHQPRADELPRWIAARASKYGGEISANAARALAESVGPDLRRLDQEIAKLAAFVDLGQTIGPAEIQELVQSARHDVFALHDAVAERKAGPALAAVNALLDAGGEPAELFAQVTGVIRRLLVVKELGAQGRSVAREGPTFGLSSSSYAQDKLRRQAARLSGVHLEQAYRVLWEADLAVKSGRLDPEVALELTVAELAGIEPASPFGSSEP
jgi:DNA polymerase-3 subunit delta